MFIDIKEEVHEVRMKTECQDYFEIDKEDFKLVLGRFKKKKTKSYDLFTMASESFQNSVFKLTNRMVEEEDFPKRCDEKKRKQLWKNKGLRENLNNHRYIHMKDWLPRLCKGLIVDKMKSNILEGGTVHQIGGIPGHCSEEHLVSVRSIIHMQRCINLNSGCIVQLVDIQIFF